VSEEIQPYLLYRINGDQLECTIWKLRDGEKAVALFLTAETAGAYHKTAHLGPEWKLFQPGKEALLQLLGACHGAGIHYAVLDPDATQAKRIFDLGQVLAAAQGSAPG
jgi:hypothetical protein